MSIIYELKTSIRIFFLLTFIHDGDRLLRNGRAGPLARYGIQIKLVARAVLEVEQSD